MLRLVISNQVFDLVIERYSLFVELARQGFLINTDFLELLKLILIDEVEPFRVQVLVLDLFDGQLLAAFSLADDGNAELFLSLLALFVSLLKDMDVLGVNGRHVKHGVHV